MMWAGSGKVLLAVRIVFLNRVQNLQIHVMRANQYICIFSQFSEFRIQNMHSTLYVYFQSIFRNKSSTQYSTGTVYKVVPPASVALMPPSRTTSKKGQVLLQDLRCSTRSANYKRHTS